MECTLQWLQGDELDQLDELFREHAWFPLNKALSRVRVAIDTNGKIVACLAVQCIPHVEPLWVSPDHRGTGLAKQIVTDVVNMLVEVNPPVTYIIADSPFAGQLAEAHGMSKIECPVYYRAGE